MLPGVVTLAGAEAGGCALKTLHHLLLRAVYALFHSCVQAVDKCLGRIHGVAEECDVVGGVTISLVRSMR